MAYSEVQSITRTLGDILDFMAPFAGGSVPAAASTEYAEWVRWIQDKQESYARRAFWRRCLTRDTIALTTGLTTVLPDRFHKPNGLYMLIVDEVDWNEHGNSDGQTIFVEMINDIADGDFGKWRMRFNDAVVAGTTATIWYFSIPPKPNETTDLLLLPGDMIGYAALSEYFRQANQEGSQDKAEEDAENRFAEYLGLEVIPDKSDLLVNSEQQVNRVDRLALARNQYRSRVNRNTQV